MSTLIGMELDGRYRLDARVGSGGMSTVYRAFDTTLERRVAIKLMHREIASDSDQLERFRREARAVAQLSHPHVVGVIDAGEDDHRPYIVLEYVEGETLKDRIRRVGPLPVQDALAYGIEVGRALGAAHERGIVHRDIKPQNVLVDREGSAKVTDFGIARTLEEDGLTADGRVLGTTDYVAPEQALGHTVTGQSDVYSLGVVLWEMLVGDVPFKAETQVAVAMKHVREDLPDVQVRRPGVSSALAAVIERATDKDLARRHPDAASLVHDLEDVLALETSRSGQSTGEAHAILRTLPAPARRRVHLRLHPPVIVVVLAFIAVIGGLVLAFQQGPEQVERGTGAPRDPAPVGFKYVSVKETSATAYDPAGDQTEGDATARNAVDADPSTTWATERYYAGALNKPGVGLYVDADPRVDAARLRLFTPTPGFKVEVYVANEEPPATWPSPAWTKVAFETEVTRERQDLDLDTGGRAFRYYLVWVTDPGKPGKVELSRVSLLERQRR